MTILIEETFNCAICGKESEHKVIVSTNNLGGTSLDTRTFPAGYDILETFIQTCPSCGYCAPRISAKIEGTPEIIKTDSYRQQLKSTEFPSLANAFLCCSFIIDSNNEYTQAGWQCLLAAWACDDKGYHEPRFADAARKCRIQAITLLQKAKENGQSFGTDPGAEEALLVDLLRRTGQFEPARMMCDEGLNKKPKKIIKDILRFQQKLIDESDLGMYTVDEAQKWARKNKVPKNTIG